MREGIVVDGADLRRGEAVGLPGWFVLACVWATVSLSTEGCGRDKVSPPVPRATMAWVDTLPPVPASYFDVPVRYDLAPALRWLESEVPAEFGDIEQRRPVRDKKQLEYAYAAKRTPFRLAIKGRRAVLQADVEYEARVWYDAPVLPKVSASCGTEGERPRARLTIESDVELTETWALRPHTRAEARPITETDRDKCKVSVLSIDVTKKVMEAAREALHDKLNAFDARLAAFDLPKESRRLWNVLQSPQKLTDSLWLVMDPTAVRVGLLEMQGDTLVTALGISGNPRVIGGARPDPAQRPMPSPQDSASRPPVFHLLTEGHLPYEVASTILSRELRGDTIHVGKQELIVDSLEIRGVGDGRAAVGLAVSGAAKGVLYVMGHPAYDTATSALYMPDLEYDVGTRDLLTGALAWLAGGAVEDYLRNKVRIKLGKVIEDGRKLLEKNLNRDLADGVHLHATVTTGRGLIVRAAPEALLLRVIASGQGQLVLDLRPQEIVGPKPLGASTP